MLFSALLSLLPLAVAAPIELAKRQSFGGRATFYDVGLGACGGYNVASDFIVALNAPQYGGGYPGPNCGRSMTISYGGKSATAVVRDLCPGCGYGDLDMSRGLFNYFGHEDMGVFQMSWHWNDGNAAPAPAPAPAPSPEPTTTPPPPPPSPTPSPQPQYTPSSAAPPPPPPSSSSTTTTTTTSHQASSSLAAVAAVISSLIESPSASSVSSVSSAAPSASAPANAQVLAADGNNLAAVASAVINLGRIAVVGSNGTQE